MERMDEAEESDSNREVGTSVHGHHMDMPVVHSTDPAQQTFDKKVPLDAEPRLGKWRCRNRRKECSTANS